MTVTLVDGTKLAIMSVEGKTIQFQGAYRNSLLFLFDPDEVTLEEVQAAFTEDNTSTITLSDEENGTYIHENYTIRTELGCGYKSAVGFAGSVLSTDTTQVVYCRMAQSTLAERQLLEQQETIDALVAAALEE